MAEESKEIDPKIDEAAVKEVIDGEPTASTTNEVTGDEDPEGTSPDAMAAGAATKKKKSKKAKLKKALGIEAGQDAEASSSSNPASKLTDGMVEQLLEMNPSLKSEVAGMDKANAAAAVKKLDIADLLTGMVSSTQRLLEKQVADVLVSP